MVCISDHSWSQDKPTKEKLITPHFYKTVLTGLCNGDVDMVNLFAKKLFKVDEEVIIVDGDLQFKEFKVF